MRIPPRLEPYLLILRPDLLRAFILRLRVLLRPLLLRAILTPPIY